MGNARRVTTTLDGSSDSLTLASVFQAFDQLRQRLSFQTHGVAGAFTGFTTLSTHAELLTDRRAPSRILVSATVTDESARTTRVEYQASFGRETCVGWGTWVIVRGSGVTVHPTGCRYAGSTSSADVNKRITEVDP
jgi:hypothetical protein